MTADDASDEIADVHSVPSGWELRNHNAGATVDSVTELRELLQKDLMDREFYAVDDDCEVHISWGGLSQQWRVYSVRDGEPGPDTRFNMEQYQAAIGEALDRMRTHATTGQLPD